MPSPPISLIVNADDLGISVRVNEAIFDYHDRGLVTSATLLVNGPAAEHAVQGAQKRPGLGVGVHLDTSEFPPLSERFSDVREERPDLDLRTTYFLPPSVLSAVADEWSTQIERARELGVDPTHLDSHHFDHVNPALLPSLASVTRSSGLRCVRGTFNLWTAARPASVRFAKALHRQLYRIAGVRTTDLMCDAETFLTRMQSASVPAGSSIEIMTHPGHVSYVDENVRIENEVAALKGVQLINWRDL